MPVPAQVYRITDTPSWDEAQRTGSLPLSALDRRDGYVHLSTASQVPGTLRRFFADRRDLVLLTISAARLADLRYESPSSPDAATINELFPHAYGGPLPLDAIIGVDALELDGAGVHRLPAQLSRALLDEDDSFTTVELDVAWDAERAIALIEYPRATRIEDEAGMLAWEATLERHVGPLAEQHGGKVAAVIGVDNLHVAPKLTRRYTELVDKVVSRWFTTIARWTSHSDRREFFAHANDARALPADVFSSREQALAHVLESRQPRELCSILSR